MVYGSNGPVGFHDTANTSAPVVVIGRKGSYGRLQYVDEAVFAIDTTYTIDKANTSCDLRWLYYVLSTLGLDALSSDVGVPGLARERAHDLDIPLLDVSAQRAIADYLDTETARVDALIAKKSNLSARLDERLLEAARSLVVGGRELADPLDVRQDELAPGWRTLMLGRHLAFGSGTTPNSGELRFYGPGVPWIVTGDLRDRELKHVSCSVTEAALAEFSALKVYPAGSLVIAMYGATVGRLGLTTFPAAVNQACCVMQKRDEVDLRFLFFYLFAHRPVLLERCLGAGQPNISQEILRSLNVAVPDVPEQVRIADEIVGNRHRNFVVGEKLARQVEQLREHRQALITAAVTGELDVPPPSA